MQDNSLSTLIPLAAEKPSPSEMSFPKPTAEMVVVEEVSLIEEVSREEMAIRLAHSFSHSTYEKYFLAALRRYLEPVPFNKWLEIAMEHIHEKHGGFRHPGAKKVHS